VVQLESPNIRKRSKKSRTPKVIMLRTVKKAQYLEQYKIQLSFDDKSVKVIDLGKMLKTAKNMFLPLRDVNYFRQVKCDGTTLIWPNGVDLCPDVLYKMGKNIKQPIPKAKHAAASPGRRRKSKAK
jgi:Protein of unknown function (DUF2442)